MTKKTLIASAIALASTNAFAEAPSNEEMWNVIQQQKAEISELKSQLNATADVVEQRSADGHGQSGQTTLGGYAEMHHNNLNTGNEIDLHRFVLFIGHQFNDRLRMFSELEVEHSLAGDGKPGEVEVEQAYIEYDFAAKHSAKAGLFLVPVGILNETHEPDTFYGVERNNVEKNIIPTTWWEGGVAVGGELAPGLSYDATYTSGLFLDGSAAIRSGRQKVAEASAEAGALTGRLKYTGIPGLELATTVQYQEDLEQGAFSSEIDATLFEAHAIYRTGPFAVRALYAQWDIDKGIEQSSGVAGADKQKGFYIEPSYKVSDDLGIFVRYSEWDNTAGTDSASQNNKQSDAGVNYWLYPTVALKADYQYQEKASGQEVKGVNLAVGWSF